MSALVLKLLMESRESGSQPLGGLGWVGSVGCLGDCLGFAPKEISVLVSASGSCSADLGI